MNNLFGGEDSEGVDEYGNPRGNGGGMDTDSIYDGRCRNFCYWSSCRVMGTLSRSRCVNWKYGYHKSPKPKPKPPKPPKPSGGFFSEELMDLSFESAYSGAKSMASNAYSGSKRNG